MGITFVPLSEADPAGVRELLISGWQREWDGELVEGYIAWRYGARSSGETLLACNEGQCVGILDSFIRPYWIAGRRETVRETCDWFCLPKYRALGIGLHLMRRMMANPEPIVSIGGTEFTLDLLPRLKWARLRDVDNFILPISVRTTAGVVEHWISGRSARLARNIPDIRFGRARRRPPPSTDLRVCATEFGKDEELPSIAPYALAPALEMSNLHWLARAPPILGKFVLLSFFRNGEPVGVSISRLQTLP